MKFISKSSTEQRRPFLNLASAGAASLWIIIYVLAPGGGGMSWGMKGAPTSLSTLAIVWGLMIIGAICAFVALRRNERYRWLSTGALFVNGLPVFLTILFATVWVMLGGNLI